MIRGVVKRIRKGKRLLGGAQTQVWTEYKLTGNALGINNGEETANDKGGAVVAVKDLYGVY